MKGENSFVWNDMRGKVLMGGFQARFMSSVCSAFAMDCHQQSAPSCYLVNSLPRSISIDCLICPMQNLGAFAQFKDLVQLKRRKFDYVVWDSINNLHTLYIHYYNLPWNITTNGAPRGTKDKERQLKQKIGENVETSWNQLKPVDACIWSWMGASDRVSHLWW